MSKLEVVKFLIQEIEEEQELFKEYNRIEKEARNFAHNGKGTYWEYRSKNWGDKREPKKSRIQLNCTKVRQLLLDIGKEV